MAVNENGNLVDDAGNIVIDHVWGNMPMQPNDVRIENGGAVLDPTLSNHVLVTTGWNGYPMYAPNTDGEFVDGVAYALVPSVVGKTLARATAILIDSALVIGTVTTSTAGATSVNNGKVKTQAVAAGADSIATGTAVDVVLYEFVVVPRIAPTTSWSWSGTDSRFFFPGITSIPQMLNGSAASYNKLVITGGSYAGVYSLTNGGVDTDVFVAVTAFPAGSTAVAGVGAGGADGGTASVVPA